MITENCNSKCLNCFNSTYREKKEINVDTYIKLCEYLFQNNIKRIKIMGGEPTVHSSFEKIITISQSYFNSVVVFTNALNDRIANIQPRKSDTIVYNFNFISSRFDTSKFLLEHPGNRRLEVQIGSRTNIEHLIKRLSLVKRIPNLSINLTLDCMENIFDNRIDLEKKFMMVSDFITNDLKTNYLIDHKIPSCFWNNNNNKSTETLCSVDCAGLIDSSLMLRYCNQFEEVICSIIDSNGGFIPFDRLLSQLNVGYVSKTNLLKDKTCNNCGYFPIKCNGGCFAHKNFVKLPTTIDNERL